MHRIDGAGATITNLFTEGNPSLGIPATVVTDDWANDVQEELCNLVEDQGITLVKGTQTQVLAAIKSLIGNGGNEFQQDIDNNQAVATSIAGLLFSSASVKAAQFDFEIYRQTVSGSRIEAGTCFLSYRTATSAWELSQSTQFDDSGVTLSVTSGGQVQYISDNFAGASYVGKIRVTAIRKFRQTL